MQIYITHNLKKKQEKYQKCKKALKAFFVLLFFH